RQCDLRAERFGRPGSRRYQPLRLEPACARRQESQGRRRRRADDRGTHRAPRPVQRDNHRGGTERHAAVHGGARPARDHVAGGPRGPVRPRTPDSRPHRHPRVRGGAGGAGRVAARELDGLDEESTRRGARQSAGRFPEARPRGGARPPERAARARRRIHAALADPDLQPASVAQRHGAERGRGPHPAGARSARGAVGEARQRARRVARHRDGGSRGLQSNAARPERARRGRGGRQALMFDAIVLVATLLGGGDTLSGRVADPDGNAVAGATVTVVELHRVAVTQADGAYRLADLPPGRYTISVRGLGFAPVARDVAVRGATTLSVTLTRTAIWVEPVTITATGAPLAAGLSPLPTQALSEDRLQREQSVSLAHALGSLPGINALTTGQQIGKPVIRGLTGPRVLVLEDGSRLEDYSWSDEDGPSVDTRLAQRVEVIRGPASVLYGSDALGGVVNVIPEELPDANGGPRAVRSGFEISAASNNAELEGAARVEGASGGWGWRLFGIGRFASSLHTPAGELDNTGFNALSGEAAVGTRGARGSTTLRYTR